jgi:hypothetical protein
LFRVVEERVWERRGVVGSRSDSGRGHDGVSGVGSLKGGGSAVDFGNLW